MSENVIWGIGFKDETGYMIRVRVLDGDRKKIEYVDTTPDLEGGLNSIFEPGRLYAGRAVKPDHVPTKVEWGNKRVKPYDFVDSEVFIFVSDTVKDLVERFEPEVHQFFPVEFIYKDGSHARQMYFFNICARLDTMDRERATADLKRNVLWDPRTGDFVFSKALIGNHHVWIDKHVCPGRLLSDSLKSALEEANVNGVSFRSFPSF